MISGNFTKMRIGTYLKSEAAPSTAQPLPSGDVV